jgi:hypothetical protein
MPQSLHLALGRSNVMVREVLHDSGIPQMVSKSPWRLGKVLLRGICYLEDRSVTKAETLVKSLRI